MYDIEVNEKLKQTLDKLLHKDKALYEATLKKMDEIVSSENPDHYKNLKHPLNDYKRVHIASSFVLLFKIDCNRNLIIFHKLRHHDDVYKW